MHERLSQIRQAEAESHTKAYTNHELFAPGSWLAKPVKTVLELLPLFAGYTELKALDLGCGVGRNCIPVAQHFRHIPCQVDCVDILELAIDKLNQNACRYGVSDSVNGIVASIDDYTIQPGKYDLILAISALEHVNSKDVFIKKLYAICNGLRLGGIACLIINTGVQEWDKETGAVLPPQFEINLQTQELQHIMEQIFSDCHMIRHTVVHQKYSIPRSQGISDLETDVATWIFKKTN